MEIRRVAIIGTSEVGVELACQIASAKHPVFLLNVNTQEDNSNSDGAQNLAALEKMISSLLVASEYRHLIEIGTIEEDLPRIQNADWVFEALAENLDFKHQIYTHITPFLQSQAILSSCSFRFSTEQLTEGFSLDLKERFSITHFIRPVRYIPFYEQVSGQHTRVETVQRLGKFCDVILGKTAVPCQDIAGFLFYRIGVFSLITVLDVAKRLGIHEQTANALFGSMLGDSKNGVFQFLNKCSLESIQPILQNLQDRLPATDPLIQAKQSSQAMHELLEKYQVSFVESPTQILYENTKNHYLKPEHCFEHIDDALRYLFAGDDKEAQFCRVVFSRIFAYVTKLMPSVTENPEHIDIIFKFGCNYPYGLFEIIDRIGIGRVAHMIEAAGLDVPPYLCPENRLQSTYYIHQSQICVRHFDGEKRPLTVAETQSTLAMKRPVMRRMKFTKSASVLKLGSDLIIEFHNKVNLLNPQVFEAILFAVEEVNKGRARGIILYNDGRHFSAGLDLRLIRKYCLRGDWGGLDRFLQDFQQATSALRYAAGPVVCAAAGCVFSGGLSVALHSDVVIAHINTSFGFVETGCGMIPVGGGVKETLRRWNEKKAGNNETAIHRSLTNIGYSIIASSPQMAVKLGYFRPDWDKIVMHRYHLLPQAQAWLDTYAKTYQPPIPSSVMMAGATIHQQYLTELSERFADELLTTEDVALATALSNVLTGGSMMPTETFVSEEDILLAERANFLELVQMDAMRRRMEQFLNKNGS